MKCKDCSACKKGWFQSRPDAYVCTGVLEPFVIENVGAECTQYKERRDYDINEIIFQLKCIKEHLKFISLTTDKSVDFDIQVLNGCISQLEYKVKDE